jgi:hypothetical protein
VYTDIPYLPDGETPWSLIPNAPRNPVAVRVRVHLNTTNVPAVERLLEAYGPVVTGLDLELTDSHAATSRLVDWICTVSLPSELSLVVRVRRSNAVNSDEVRRLLACPRVQRVAMDLLPHQTRWHPHVQSMQENDGFWCPDTELNGDPWTRVEWWWEDGVLLGAQANPPTSNFMTQVYCHRSAYAPRIKRCLRSMPG